MNLSGNSCLFLKTYFQILKTQTKITMKSKTTFFVISTLLIGLIFFTPGTYAQQKSDDQAKTKKTITIHVTKEVDGNTIVIDTTVITDGDFDADAYLKEKGVMKDMPEAGKNVEKHIIIRHPGSGEFSWNGSDGNSPDTIIIKDDKVLIFKDNHDMLAPSVEGMPFDFNFNMPHAFPHMESQQFEMMLEGLARSFGVENVWPFGEMKQMVVKKKRNGKKVIITFEDRMENSDNIGLGNKKEEKVIILKNGEQGMMPQNNEQVIIEGQEGENVVIRRKVIKTENGEQVIINAEVDSPTPVVKEKKVIIITEGEAK